jgi:hypothetical protein
MTVNPDNKAAPSLLEEALSQLIPEAELHNPHILQHQIALADLDRLIQNRIDIENRYLVELNGIANAQILDLMRQVARMKASSDLLTYTPR